MITILLGSEKTNTFENYFQFLKNKFDINLITAKTGVETIKKCRILKPAIIILHTEFSDMFFTDIIKELCNLSTQHRKTNLILIVNNPNEKIYLKDTSVIYKIFELPFNEDELTKTIKFLELSYSNNPLTFNDIEKTLDNLGLGIKKSGTQYIISAIHTIYYHQDTFVALNKIYEIVAKEFHVLPSQVKSAIRYSIESIDYLKNEDIKKLYETIFGTSYKLSNKMFFEALINYLYLKKRIE